MAKNLIIVESPTKVKTIKKFLGTNYQVIASNGHIRDLPKSKLGIDIENDFEPYYITIRGKGDKLSEIKKEAKKADKVYLATDPDREGEAIAWHLKNAIANDKVNFQRITFNEITKTAVKSALKNPRDINMDLVDAQQARRAIDRIVGYRISPLLWKKIKKGLSAGRVQSVALKLIVDRDKEIQDFQTEEYYTIEADFVVENKMFTASLSQHNNSKIVITKQNAETIVENLKSGIFSVDDVKKTIKQKLPPLPFTTSTLQQEAYKKLGFAVAKTMKVAQELYEGVNISGHGTVGLITYLRTDSTRISDEAKEIAVEYIKNNFGDKYLQGITRKVQNGNIQDAHEAIRPSYLELEPMSIISSLTKDQGKLYTLIWNRFLASQMAPAENEHTSVNICSNDGYLFKANTSKNIFKGYLDVYAYDDVEKTNKVIDQLTTDDKIKLNDIRSEVHYTEPPAHYTEASLIKTLESLGIGRPSTYAPTVITLKARRYIAVEKKSIYATELGTIVDGIMNNCFKEFVDVKFTANMESELDSVAEGKHDWKNILREYYPILDKEVQEAEEKLEKITILDEVTDEICEKCGKNMVIKYGPHGKFLACPGFPECKNSRPYYEKIGVKCPKCGGDIVVRLTPKNRKYYGCINYPDCDFATWNEPVGRMCPECSEPLIKKGKKITCSNKVCRYEEK